MKAPSHADAFEVLCLQMFSDGRGDVLFGPSLARVRETLRPLMVGEEFPSVYFEFPLCGEPFLDVTVLYNERSGVRKIESDAVRGLDALFAWYAEATQGDEGSSFGFELDVGKQDVPVAGIHFQPRSRIELVEPFCEVVGEADKASLYLEFSERAPDDWKPSFFGMFRGRPGSPLRVCGYLSVHETQACAKDRAYMKSVFDQVGFTAYDDSMVDQVCELLSFAPGVVDYQFDIYPDGTLGEVFAFDVQFEIEQTEAVHENFRNGPASKVMGLLERWGVADERWKLGIDATFARSIPVELSDGATGKLCFVIMPQWVKIRWRNGVLQPSKIYHYGNAEVLD